MNMTESSITTKMDDFNMRQFPRILIITSCTNKKQFKPSVRLTLEDFKNPTRLKERSVKLIEFAGSAGKMYTGQQHLRAMEGVTLLRQSLGEKAVDVKIISAAYGLISEDKIILPYEVSFNTMKKSEVYDLAKFLGIHEAFEQAIVGYDLIFVLLGDNYLRSLRLPVATESNQTFIFLTSKLSANYVIDLTAKTFILPLSNEQAKHYRYGLVGLKGFLFKQFATVTASKPELLVQLHQNPEIFLEFIEREPIQ